MNKRALNTEKERKQDKRDETKADLIGWIIILIIIFALITNH